jgi:hypothetical protein
MDDIASLTSSDAWWGNVLLISTLIVLIGIIGEGVAELTKLLDGCPSLKKFVEVSSVLILVIGIAGELWGEARTSSIGDQISGFLNVKAGAANDRAAAAEKDAAEANLKAEQLRCESAALEMSLSPRRLAPHRTIGRTPPSPKEEKFNSMLRPYANTIVKVQSASDFEAQELGEDIEYLLNRAGWIAVKTDESESHFKSVEMNEGVTLYISQKRDDTLRASTAVLVSALSNVGLTELSRSWMPPQSDIKGPNFSGNSGFAYLAVGPRPIGRTISDLKINSPCKQ